MAAWLAADCEDSTIIRVLRLPWLAIWSEVENDRLSKILASLDDIPAVVVHALSDVPPTTRGRGITYIFDTSISTGAAHSAILRKRRHAEELENKVEGYEGVVIAVGSGERLQRWHEILSALAPEAKLIVAPPTGSGPGPSLEGATPWDDSANQLLDAISSYYVELGKEDVLDLKDASGISPDGIRVEAIADSWELMTRGYVQAPAQVLQADFDAFLSGDAVWPALRAGAACSRGSVCSVFGNGRRHKEQLVDPIDFVRDRIRNLDQSDIDPLDSIEHILLFAEAGSGCTTTLRQIALAVARDGYPTMITRPDPKELSIESLQHLIIDIQEKWAAARTGRGSGSGSLPFCLILDSDAELPARFSRLLRGQLADINRKVLVVRALRRSESELDNSAGVLRLRADTDEAEVLKIGAHLRDFCASNGLQAIPTDDEWKAYYEGFGRLRRHSSDHKSAGVVTPPLFLVGLYPFVKDRVRDERSLERYLFRRWSEISTESGRLLVRILATAGAYGLSVPLESLLREQSLEEPLFGRVSIADQRLLDSFFRWNRLGWERVNWGVHIRHQAIGLLLMRIIDPLEGEAPFAGLLPTLSRLAGSEADRWFAEQIAYVIGRRFQSGSRSFSLDVDTQIQRAAREIFSAIPREIEENSRTICHHRARFYVHVLHACVEAIENPEQTRVPIEACFELADSSISEASRLLVAAAKIPDQHEKLSHVFNTLSAGLAQFAQACSLRGKVDRAGILFKESLDRASEAIERDPANGHALFNYVGTALRVLEKGILEDLGDAIATFERAEDRLEDLINLNSERRWNNTDEESADFQIAQLAARLIEVAKKLSTGNRVLLDQHTMIVVSALLKIRMTCRTSPLKEAFLDPQKAKALREVRKMLEGIANPSSATSLCIYKLMLGDPIGRIEFERRLEVLDSIRTQNSAQYEPYRHDHAALLCQLGHFEAAASIFRAISNSRIADPDSWFWINERVLLDVSGVPTPKSFVVRVTDEHEGWSVIKNTGIRVKFQPRQFGDIKNGQYLPVYLRIRLLGLQGVTRRFADHDLQTMGLGSPQNG
ncbi:hypothetical protein KQ910_04800 [Reyranella sp. MMS21-HV4-11]|uniref:Tetratricopeptide repeat protein n=1 Tax=Reyranella humidisoli TaxID=2849149 RepID=A0ABS6IEN6_9HYPH|nr:hypothetical protein [Reyranella sp. MMS21-HV4-11]MBU8873067.1 hypothetical protein [Reyranella sp. MMS21-HV4-11]